MIRTGWRESEVRDEHVLRCMQAERKLAILHALGVLVPTHLVLQGFSVFGVLGVIALAVLVGEAWWRVRAGQVATPMIAGTAFFLFELLWLGPNPFHVLGYLIATTFVALCAAYLGLRRELRITE